MGLLAKWKYNKFEVLHASDAEGFLAQDPEDIAQGQVCAALKYMLPSESEKREGLVNILGKEKVIAALIQKCASKDNFGSSSVVSPKSEPSVSAPSNTVVEVKIAVHTSDSSDSSPNVTPTGTIRALSGGDIEIEGAHPSKAQIEVWIEKYSKLQGIDPNLTRAVIEAESSWNPNVVSKSGAKGLMQLMPETAKTAGLKSDENLMDPEVNIRVGTRHLAGLNRHYEGGVNATAMAYNAGRGAVKATKIVGGKEVSWKVPDSAGYNETRRYEKKVVKFYEEYSAGKR